MFNGQIILPFKHTVPYEEKVSFIAETTNMVGQTLGLKLYKSKSLTDRNGTFVVEHSTTVNSDGKIAIPFTLESKWRDNDNTQPYFYVHIEKDMPWWSSDIEKDSVTLRAYCEGDVLGKGVEVLSLYNPDHGDFYDPLINPNIRGWYNPNSTTNKDSNIKGWNPYGSLKYGQEKNDGTKKYSYGRVQRAGNSHSGLDIYAPVGTPIYACVDGIITYKRFLGKKAGFMIQLEGDYKGKTYIFQYLHLMQIKANTDTFRFYNSYDSKVPNDGFLDLNNLTNPFKDPIAGETYKIQYSGSILTIDNNKNCMSANSPRLN